MSQVRIIVTPQDNVNINAGASNTSTEVDIGDNTKAEQIWIYLEIASWAGVPSGRFELSIYPRHTTAGDNFSDDAAPIWFSTTANQVYRFGREITSLPRFFVVNVRNNTAQNATGITCKIEYQKVT